jgi:hypothetical protein
MSFADMTAELVGTIPRMSALHAQQVVNRAWSRVRDSRLWSFHFVSDAQLFVPNAVPTPGFQPTMNLGSIAVEFGSKEVIPDSLAAAMFNSLAMANPPLASPILGVGRQLRVGTTNGLSTPTGPNYNITQWDGSTLLIDRPYGERSALRCAFQILKCYYAPPAPPPYLDLMPDLRFVKYDCFTNRNNGYAIFGPNLYWSQAQLNAIDPQRGGQGDAYIVANYGRNQLGQQVIELYPNPVQFTTYSCTYFTRWANLSPSTDLPQVAYELEQMVMFESKCLAADWALANVNSVPELGQTNWVNYRQTQMAEFKASMIQCFKQDDEIMPLIPFRQGQGFMFPLGGQFLQSHDVSSILPRGY